MQTIASELIHITQPEAAAVIAEELKPPSYDFFDVEASLRRQEKEKTEASDWVGTPNPQGKM